MIGRGRPDFAFIVGRAHAKNCDQRPKFVLCRLLTYDALQYDSQYLPEDGMLLNCFIRKRFTCSVSLISMLLVLESGCPLVQPLDAGAPFPNDDIPITDAGRLNFDAGQRTDGGMNSDASFVDSDAGQVRDGGVSTGLGDAGSDAGSLLDAGITTSVPDAGSDAGQIYDGGGTIGASDAGFNGETVEDGGADDAGLLPADSGQTDASLVAQDAGPGSVDGGQGLDGGREDAGALLTDGGTDSGPCGVLEEMDPCGVCGGDSSTCLGCDGIPNSGLTYDACGVCGGPKTQCTSQLVLGYISANSADGTQEQCGLSPNRWNDCNRDHYQEDCVSLGRSVSWGAGQYDDYALIDSPVTAYQACQDIYGHWEGPWRGFSDDIYSVYIDSALANGLTDEHGCAIYECVASFCPQEQSFQISPQCTTAEEIATPVIVEGFDWTIPDWMSPEPNTGYYKDRASSGESDELRSLSLTWSQLNPAPGVFEMGASVLFYPSVNSPNQTQELQALLNKDLSHWLRIYTAAVGWAPDWLSQSCPSTQPIPYDDDGVDVHFWPIWDSCVWSKLLDMYTVVFGSCEVVNGEGVGHCAYDSQGDPIAGWGLREDPRMRYVYVPGAFRWAEYDFGIIERAEELGLVTQEEYVTWFEQHVIDLVSMMNGDPADPSDDYAWKLVFTGEDFPYSVPDSWNADTINHLPQYAVEMGMGIRNGISENHSSHHHHVPAYGASIDWNGQVTVNEDWVAYDGQRMLGTEQECFNGCGASLELEQPAVLEDLRYAVYNANLVSLRSRMNWMYVSDGSFQDVFPEHWNWVRYNLGRRIDSADEGWAVLRDSRDRFFDRRVKVAPHQWMRRPWVRNIERFVIQKEVCHGGITKNGTLRLEGDFWESDPTRVVNEEGRRTQRDAHQDFIYFEVSDRFHYGESDTFQLKVTYVDQGNAEWWVEYTSNGCLARTGAVTNQNSGGLKTVTFDLADATFDNALPEGTDFRIYNGGVEDIEVRMTRLLRTHEKDCGDGERSADEECDDGNTTGHDGCSGGCDIEPNFDCDQATPDNCDCQTGWTGPNCTEPICSLPCQNGSQCTAPDRCACPWGFTGEDCSIPFTPVSCSEIQLNPDANQGDGMYQIDPMLSGEPVDVYCDMTTEGGGWTLVWASMDGASAGKPWEPVPENPADLEDFGPFGRNPLNGRVRLPLNILTSIPQTETLYKRVPPAPAGFSEQWLRVEHTFFSADDWNLLSNEREITASLVSVHYPVANGVAELKADLGIAMENRDADDIDEDGDTEEILPTEESWIRNGGWFGLAWNDVNSGGTHNGLSGNSGSRRFLNDGCADHFLYVYKDAEMAISMSSGDGWPGDPGCSTSSSSVVGLWILLR
jgi:cysteine-rich repeat protein